MTSNSEWIATSEPVARHSDAAAVVPRRDAARSSATTGHVVQLDSLRGLAVAGVMIHHFWPAIEKPFILGNLGVKLFFVLSGFLITGILLRCRDLVRRGEQGTAITLRQFYVRRFLRIFPMFYGTLIALWLLGVPEVRDSIGWHLGYLTNVYLARNGAWHGEIGHFWSLAVEEQFYLVWPALVLFTPRRWLLPAFLGAVAIGPLYRLLGTTQHFNELALWTLPFASLDALGIGAVLAYASHAGGAVEASIARWLRRGAVIAVAAVTAATVLNDSSLLTKVVQWVLAETGWAFLFAWTVASAARGFGGTAGRVLDLGALSYVGRISYGLYVIHPFMWRAVPRLFQIAHAPWPAAAPSRFIWLTVTALIAASLSWYFYERPLNELKRYFPYRLATAARSGREQAA